jgi:hypothetical protein
MEDVMRKPILRLVMISYLFPSPLSLAASNPYGLPEKLHETLTQGLFELFNSDFENAEKKLAPLKDQAEHYPLLALGEVVRHWWKISSYVEEGDETVSKKFLDSAEWALTLAKNKVSQGDKTGQAYLVWGTTLGLLSRWSAANRAWVPAYIRGSRSASYSRKALAQNKKAIDAYLTIGTFNYARALMSEKIQPTADFDLNIDIDQEEENGLDQLRKVYEDGLYFKHASGLLLAGILTNENPKEALPLLIELKTALPRSGFVQIVYLTALYNAGELSAMESEINEFFIKIETGIFSQEFKPQALFARGLLAFKAARWNEAQKEFDNAVKTNQAENPYVTWALLYRGYCWDALGKRDKAKKDYLEVLKLPRRFASHDHAKERLSKPFKSTDLELKKLEL